MAVAIRLRDSRVRLEDERDAELLAMLPLPVSPLSEGDTVLDTSEVKDASSVEVLRSPRKRLSSE